MASAPAPDLEAQLTRYGYSQLRELARTPALVLWRAHEASCNRSVLIKYSLTGSDLSRELSFLRRLSSSGATLTPVSCSANVLVLEDPEDAVIGALLNSTHLESFLDIARALAWSVGTVHSHGVIHGDIQPSSILYSPSRKKAFLFHLEAASLFSSTRPGLAARGALQYMAPEATGRIGVVVDHRSDLYSLGVLFYQLLTGSLPFQQETIAELLHAILAVSPLRAEVVRPNLPPVLVDIVHKLLQKSPDDRYQSGYGLLRDLARCAEHPTFAPLGEYDRNIRWRMPNKLSGRNTELAVLYQVASAFAASPTPRRTLLISGEPGCGKTAFLASLRNFAVPGWSFGSGKFEQCHRHVPFQAFIPALTSLLHSILALPAPRLKAYRDLFLQQLGPNASLLFPSLPLFERVVGPQPPLPDLPERDLQARMDSVGLGFLKVLTAENHLVLALDDLQWADSASLRVLRLLIGSPELPRLLIVGSYRSSEVDEKHPLWTLIRKSLPEARVAVEEIHLGSISSAAIAEIIGESIDCGAQKAAELAAVVAKKTLGNPFFALQFLKNAFEEQLIRFDMDAGEWRIDLAALTSLQCTENVAKFMSQRLSLLSSDQQLVLSWAACIGTEFPVELLQQATGLDPETLQAILLKLKAESYIAECAKGYRFTHDTIEQAAYDLLSADARHTRHHCLGTLVAARSPDDLFALVAQRNKSNTVSLGRAEAIALAHLNRRAGDRARRTLAYDAAFEYFSVARRLLRPEDWTTEHELAFHVTSSLSFCQTLTSQFADAERTFGEMLAHGASAEERMTAIRFRLSVLHHMSRFKEAAAMAISALRQLGFDVAEEPTDAEVVAAVGRALKTLEGHDLNSILALRKRGGDILDLSFLADAIPSVYWVNLKLVGLMSAIMVETSLSRNTLAPHTPAALSALGTTMSTMGDAQKAFDLGRLAVSLAKALDSPATCVTLFTLGAVLGWYRMSQRECRQFLIEVFERAAQTWDTIFSSSASQFLCINWLTSSAPLSVVAAETDKVLKWAASACPDRGNRLVIRSMQATVQALSDPTVDYLSPSLLELEKDFELNGAPVPIRWHYFLKTMTLVLLDRPTDACDAAVLGQRWTVGLSDHLMMPVFHTHYALALLARHRESPLAPENAERLALSMRTVRKYAGLSPINCGVLKLLVEAEHARIAENDKMKAVLLFDQALCEARAQGFLHYQALAAELAARCYLEIGASHPAGQHLVLAYQSYSEWGAHSKLVSLVRKFSFLESLLPKQPPLSPLAVSPHSLGTQLEAESAIKVTTALAREIEFDRLIDRLMTILMEHTNADRACLLLTDAATGDLKIAAQRGMRSAPAATEALAGSPLSLVAVNTVRHTKLHLLAEAAHSDPRFSSDSHVQTTRVKSLLAYPILKVRHLLGVIYLENNLYPGAFTHERIRTISFLATQLAISIENARLVEELTRQSDELKKKNEELAKAARLKDDFLAITSHELRTPLNGIIGTVSLLVETPLGAEQRDHVRVIDASSRSLLRLVNDLLDLSKLQASKLSIEKVPFSVVACIEASVEVVAATAAAKGLDLAYEIEAEMPGMLEGDPARLQQILLNILANGIKFTAHGSVVLAVIGCENLGTDRVELHIRVTDTGIGIPPEQMPNLFTMFGQLDTSNTRAYTGTGIGLYLCHRLLTLFGGRIWAESAGTGRGCAFHIKFPLGRSSATSSPRDSGFALSGCRVLVSASLEAHGRILRKLLSGAGALPALVLPAELSAHLQRASPPPDMVVVDLAELGTVRAASAALGTQPRVVVLTSSQKWLESSPRPAGISPVFLPLYHKKTLAALVAASAGDVPAPPSPMSLSPAVPRHVPRPNARILVVEDNQVNNRLLCQILKPAYDTVSVYDGAQALEATQRESFDLILMDIQMPIMGGFESTRELRQRGIQCPIVAVSASVEPDSRDSCLAAGMSDFLAKPITKARVISVVSKHLHRALPAVELQS